MQKLTKIRFSYSLKEIRNTLNPYRRNYNDQLFDVRSDRQEIGRIILPKKYAEKEANYSYKI